MGNPNDAALFDDLVYEQLGHYVYALFDPDTDKPFYIGKGGGREGQGNRRIIYHFEEALKHNGNEPEKTAKIKAIWGSNRDVPWKIVRSKLRDEDEAHAVEGALIDLLRGMGVTFANQQAGHGAAERGMMSPDDLRAMRAPQLGDFDLAESLMKRSIFIFNIRNGVADRRAQGRADDSRLYEEATRQYWRVGQEFRDHQNAIAIGCINGISRAAVDIEGWKQCEPRWEIVPRNPAQSQNDLNALTFKNFSAVINHCMGYWQRGGFLVIRFENKTEITVLRGVQDDHNRTIMLAPQAG